MNPDVDPAADHATVGEINRKFDEWLQVRQLHEPQWYINAANFRGNFNVSWNALEGRLINVPSVQPQRSRRQINRIFAKIRARRAKLLKNRPTWIVVPATSDTKDKMDARATGKVLDYLWRKLKLEAKFRDAIIWAESCARGYWWFGWNPDALGRVVQQIPSDPVPSVPGMPPAAPQSPQKQISDGVVGEVTVEVSSPFEVLVGNPASSGLSTQDEIIRAKVRTLDYVRARFGKEVSSEGSGSTFQYEHQISNLNAIQGPFSGSPAGVSDSRRDYKGNPNTIVVKEYFMRPNDEFPKGKYCVVAGNTLLKEQDELPFGFHDMENPFPCVEFVDVATAGQYWGTTVLEQLIDIQREYNGIRQAISTNLKLHIHPKVFVAKQHQLPEGAWTPDAGEIIEYNARPGIKDPFIIPAPNVAADAWRILDLIRTEFDDITQIYPAAEGSTQGTESGFHANLLQEASDAVHAPDIRGHEMAIEDAAYKIRRIVKQGYQVPRLISIASGMHTPDVFEFAGEDIDEYADIIVQAGSALPLLKGARIQATLDLYAKGVLGDPVDPEVRRRLLNVLELGGMDDIYEYSRIDEEMISVENSQAEDATELAQPRFFEDHQKHWIGHVNVLKSPAVMNWDEPARMGLLAHAILHAKYINHAAAYQMSIEANLEGLIPPPMLMGMPLPPGMAPGQPGGTPAGPAGAPGGAGGPPSPESSFREAPDRTPASGTASA